MKDSSMDAYPANMMEENDIFVNGEKRYLYYDASNVANIESTENAEQQDTDSPVTEPQVDVQVTFDDQTCFYYLSILFILWICNSEQYDRSVKEKSSLSYCHRNSWNYSSYNM